VFVAGGTIGVCVGAGVLVGGGTSGVCVGTEVFVAACGGSAVAVCTRGGRVGVGAIGEKIAVRVRSGDGKGKTVGTAAPGKLHDWSAHIKRMLMIKKGWRLAFMVCLHWDIDAS
jgi:hypothetical protein